MPIIIKWNKRAFSELIKAIEYIENVSPHNVGTGRGLFLQKKPGHRRVAF